MLYSILSQINKGLRRIDILRKSEIPYLGAALIFKIGQLSNFMPVSGGYDFHFSVFTIVIHCSGVPDYNLTEYSNTGFFRWEGIFPTPSGKNPAGSPL